MLLQGLQRVVDRCRVLGIGDVRNHLRSHSISADRTVYNKEGTNFKVWSGIQLTLHSEITCWRG